MTEEWRPIAGFEGLYEISNFGNVKSLCAGRWKSVMMRKPVSDKDGYLTVNLKKGGKYVCAKIHRLVAKAFLSNPNGYPQVNHMDEDKANNRVDNLEWCSCEYNNTYNDRQKRFYKPVIQLSDDGKEIRRFESVNAAAEYIGINPASISAVLSGRRFKTGGFRWQYQS